jgi:hypothetical protein
VLSDGSVRNMEGLQCMLVSLTHYEKRVTPCITQTFALHNNCQRLDMHVELRLGWIR